MNFAQLRAFHAVASEGGFTRGARAPRHQPAGGHGAGAGAGASATASLLFRRLGQRIELTEFGRELWQRTRRVFAELDDLEELLASAGELRVGRLEIGADGPFSVMDLVASFIARYPGVRVAVRIGNAARVLADLREARTDLAVLNLIEPDADAARRGAAIATGSSPSCRADHPWARRRRIELAELAAAPLDPARAGLGDPGAAARRRWTRAGLAPRIALELGSREAVREAVLAGPRRRRGVREGAGARSAPALARHRRRRSERRRSRSPACPSGASCAWSQAFFALARSATRALRIRRRPSDRSPLGGRRGTPDGPETRLVVAERRAARRAAWRPRRPG